MYSEDNIKTKLDNIKSQKKESSACENFIDFYGNNEPHINLCYNYYLEYDSKKEDYLNPIKYGIDNFKKELVDKIILVYSSVITSTF